MFKLLIVDDEILTREGIFEWLPWPDLGISHVQQAEDGSQGLDISKSYRPDIILTDIRMPNMDGIEMAFKLREINPNCKIIFMSGYSDKAYLKSAIMLKAINYVEKPLDREELMDAINSAVSACMEDASKQAQEELLMRKLEKTIPFVRSEIALQLAKSTGDINLLKEWFNTANIDMPYEANFVTAVVKLFYSTKDEQSLKRVQEELLNQLDSILGRQGLKGISAFKDDMHLIIHLAASPEEKKLLHKEALYPLLEKISNTLKNNACKFFICLGKTVHGIKSISESYTAAVLMLQKAFYFGYDSILFFEESQVPPYKFDETIIREFGKYIVNEEKELSMNLINNLTMELTSHNNLPVNSCKDIYYRLLLQLFRSAGDRGIIMVDCQESMGYLWNDFVALNTLQEVKSFSISKIESFFNYLQGNNQSKGNVSSILKFINSNYFDQNLSIQAISDYTFLNKNYLCSLFKHETGKTINQYIAEYRIEKAKELLKDIRVKITEIAEKTGYRDGNYFAKIFKKATGLSPSEYRERCQRC